MTNKKDCITQHKESELLKLRAEAKKAIYSLSSAETRFILAILTTPIKNIESLSALLVDHGLPIPTQERLTNLMEAIQDFAKS